MTTTTQPGKHPDLGDVYRVDLNPVRGTERAGRRPVLVLSDTGLQSISLRSPICPITSNQQLWPTKVIIPPGCVVSGAILLDQARMIDRKTRLLRHVGRLPDDVVTLAIEALKAFIGKYSSGPKT